MKVGDTFHRRHGEKRFLYKIVKCRESVFDGKDGFVIKAESRSYGRHMICAAWVDKNEVQEWIDKEE